MKVAALLLATTSLASSPALAGRTVTTLSGTSYYGGFYDYYADTVINTPVAYSATFVIDDNVAGADYAFEPNYSFAESVTEDDDGSGRPLQTFNPIVSATITFSGITLDSRRLYLLPDAAVTGFVYQNANYTYDCYYNHTCRVDAGAKYEFGASGGTAGYSRGESFDLQFGRFDQSYPVGFQSPLLSGDWRNPVDLTDPANGILGQGQVQYSGEYGNGYLLLTVDRYTVAPLAPPPAPGSSADHPMLPSVSPSGGFSFTFPVTQAQRVFVDPTLATGYDFVVNSGPNIASALFPVLPGDADGYDVLGFDQVTGLYDIALGHATAGTDFVFGGAGVSRFGVRGIDGGLDSANTSAFVTGLTFAGAGTVDLTQTPVTAAPTGAVPEPATWALMLGGFGLAGGALRRRRTITT